MTHPTAVVELQAVIKDCLILHELSPWHRGELSSPQETSHCTVKPVSGMETCEMSVRPPLSCKQWRNSKHSRAEVEDLPVVVAIRKVLVVSYGGRLCGI
jgi:hypothetical protein